MSSRQFILLLAVVALAGFAGGWTGSRMFPPSSAVTSITCREYHLTDAAGVRRASFIISLDDEPSLILRDRDGRRRSTLSFDENGEAFWSSLTSSSPETVNLAVHTTDPNRVAVSRCSAIHPKSRF
ncbi:hypothetical protein EHM69_09695 [candidate division KSB1 bacterium]|nr:MAG: hypothetical protein EHM69_09695 [candidate division KSB1 bacterium]